MNKEFLKILGLDFYLVSDFVQKDVQLRDGRNAIIWIHRTNGHGILDKKFWPEEVIENYYEREYRTEHSANSDGKHFESDGHFNLYRKVNENQFKHVKPYLNDSTKYLEIGPSFGGIVSQVVDCNIKECHIIEPNKSDAEYVQAKHNDVKIYNSKIENTKLPIDYYDIVTSFEVLEHIISVKSFLESCLKTLKPNGDIIIEVPNHNDVLLTCYKSSMYKKFYYHKAHIHYFTADSLIDICGHYGFKGEVESLQIYPLFNHINWCINNEPQQSATDAIHTPIPTNGSTIAEKTINEFYKRVESEYDQLINSFKLGGELIYKGKKV